MDLGLNNLIARTDASITQKERQTSIAAAALAPENSSSATLTESADALINENTTSTNATTTINAIIQSSDTPTKTTLPQVASATPSPSRSPQDHDVNNISGSLADWNFDGTSSNNSSRPRTKQSRGESRGGNNINNNVSSNKRISGSKSAAANIGRTNNNMIPSTETANRYFDTHSRLSQSIDTKRPSTVSELTQPRKSLSNKSLKLSPFGVRAKNFIGESEKLCSNENDLNSWLIKGGVKRAIKELGMNSSELRTRTLKSFQKEPGRAQLVAYHIQELRYNHYLLRRIEKVATVLSRLNDKKQKDLERINENWDSPNKRRSKKEEALAGLFEKTISSERRRLAKIDKVREKIVQVLDTDNTLLKKRRRHYQKKVSIEEKRQEVLKRRVEIQKRHLAARAKKKNRESKRARDHLAKNHEDALIKAAENLRRREEEARKRKEIEDAAKLKENNKAELVTKKRDAIKERAKALVKKRRDKADKDAIEVKKRILQKQQEKEMKWAANRELQKLRKKDREEMVRRQRDARLYEQDLAQENHEKWLKRAALLSEIETAVKNERQLHAKEHLIHEFYRRQSSKFFLFFLSAIFFSDIFLSDIFVLL